MYVFPALEGFIIVDNQTQLASSGGTSPRWRKKPKVWGRMTDLKKHLNLQIWNDYGRRLVVIYPYYLNKDLSVYNIVNQQDIGFNIPEYLRARAQKFIDDSKYLTENKFIVKEL